jgi:subtilisin family serine protease
MSALGSLYGSPTRYPHDRQTVAAALIGVTLLALAGLLDVHARADRPAPTAMTLPATLPADQPVSVPRPAASVLATENRSSAAQPTSRSVPSGNQSGQPYLTVIGAGVTSTVASPERVIVAVVDSGVDMTHPVMAGRVWENPNWRAEAGSLTDIDDCPGDRYGCSFVSAATAHPSCGYQSFGPSGAVADDNGHGTFVAGIVMAAAGTADVHIMPVKVLDCTGSGRSSQAAVGVRYAARMGARVIVLAFSGAADSPALHEAVTEARETYGALVVAAAGNDGGVEAQFPSAYSSVLGVGGTGIVSTSGEVDYLHRAPFSNASLAVRLLAPAVDIRGPVPRMLCGHREWTCVEGAPYAYASGTSYAAPLVAGASALVISTYPHLSPLDVTRLLVATARPIEGSPVGQIDMAAALARPLE